ncbi:ankyrin repeat-containing domain protein [Hypoxylon argillaceum]|nr:ankyrin repeat-containing domain protein [Hypoxylon argillaceum]KAI1152242.1 ankyrin repeat-containing domain protein [Nemania diffusa]
MLDTKAYSIGWICILSKEVIAASTCLDEKHEKLRGQPAEDYNSYTLGRMGLHNVVIAVPTIREYGLVSAATVVGDMIRSFPNLKVGLMVGIGGGALAKHDIRLLHFEEAVALIKVDPRSSPLEWNPHSEEDILSCVTKLATIVNIKINSWDTATVRHIQLAHFSVKEYLVSCFSKHNVGSDFEATIVHESLTNICVTYLLKLEHNIPLRDIPTRYPFAEYAAKYWASYAVGVKTSTLPIQNLIADFLMDTNAFQTCYRLYPLDKSSKGADETLQAPPPLYIAAFVGLGKVAQILLERRARINARGGEHGSALHAASFLGHESVVKILLEKGAKIHARIEPHGNALHAASLGGSEKVVQILLERQAKINDIRGEFGSALHAASLSGHENVVEALLGKGANVNIKGGMFGYALQAAALGGFKKVVQILLKGGAKVNARGGDYGNALYAAAFQGNEKVVEILLDNNADINIKCEPYDNALVAAANGGNEKVVKLLLEKGGNTGVQRGFYLDALKVAQVRDHQKIVSLLLDWSADMNAQVESLGSAFQPVAFGGHEEVVNKHKRHRQDEDEEDPKRRG